MEVDLGGVFAKFLHGLFEHDDLAVNVVAELFEGFGDLDVVDRAEDGAGGRSLGADGEGYVGQCGCGCLCVGFDLGELVGALTLVFLELAQVGVVGDYSFCPGE